MCLWTNTSVCLLCFVRVLYVCVCACVCVCVCACVRACCCLYTCSPDSVYFMNVLSNSMINYRTHKVCCKSSYIRVYPPVVCEDNAESSLCGTSPFDQASCASNAAARINCPQLCNVCPCKSKLKQHVYLYCLQYCTCIIVKCKEILFNIKLTLLVL